MGRRPLPLSGELLVLDRRMRALALTQGGVVTAAQCRPFGADRSAIRRMLGSGSWSCIRRGVYLDTGYRLPAMIDTDHHRRCAALVASLARPTVVSHVSAARLLSLPLRPGGGTSRACVTRRPPAATNAPLLGKVHVTDYDEADVVMICGVPVLAGARLVVDCCDAMPPDSALAVADAALA